MEIKRDTYLRRLIEHQRNGLVKVITGLRRSGKSYLLFKLFKEYLLNSGDMDSDHIIEMSFDDFGNRRYRNPEVFYDYVCSRIATGGHYVVLLDEVQLLDSFEDVLNGLLRMENVDVYVTGSNARFLSKDIVTEFRGRGDQLHINPLDFSEFMSVYDGSEERGLEEYMRYGGLPMVVLTPRVEEKEAMLRNLLDETYLNDIMTRHRVRNQAELTDLLMVLASGIGGLTNPEKLSKTFQSVKQVNIMRKTVQKYIEYFEDAFLVEKAQRYDVKGRKYIGTPMKYYFSDMGLRNALLQYRQVEKTHLMENAVYNELRMRGYSVDVGMVTVNGKNAQGVSTRSQLEVDFVCNKGSERVYVQSALHLDTEEKREQELRSLRAVKDNFRKIVITGDHTLPYQDDNGISYMNIYDFLRRR